MASKINIHLPGLTKIVLQFRPCSAFGKLNEFKTQHRHLNTSWKSLATNLGGASLQSLPGNRFVFSNFTPIWQNSCRFKGTQLADTVVSWNTGVAGIEQSEDYTPLTDADLQKGIGERINKSLEIGEAGRLFAVVYIRGMQHKVTTEDIIAVKLDFPPTVGDKLRLEKVLAVGGKDFTLFGQPLLSREVVRVDATVVEKTLSHNRIWLVYRKRKNFKRFRLFREQYTMLVINSIQVARVPEAEDNVAAESRSS
ncbi:unnamed protein product [Lymnaea stagnalis]|uniref:Large ribosomal subunit protein bL21m n=1 Tax=Lymnaea stagnalis TaxID=6523 RepID=A0AAV2HCB5_LYMST